jgi:hypothetical protein
MDFISKVYLLRIYHKSKVRESESLNQYNIILGKANVVCTSPLTSEEELSA